MRTILIFMLVGGLMFSCNHQKKLHKGDLLLNIDTSKISSWVVTHKGNTPEMYTVRKKGHGWQLELSNGNFVQADTAFIRRSLVHFNRLPIINVIDTPQTAWDALGTGDTGTEVRIYTGGKLLNDLIVGKMEFFNTDKAHFYIRPANSQTNYVVDKYLNGSFVAPLNNIRLKSMTAILPQEISGIHILSANSDAINLEIKNNEWLVNNQKTDPMAILKYLSLLSNLKGRSFTDKPVTGADFSIIIEAMQNPETEIKVFQSPDGMVYESSANKGNYFKLSTEQFTALFPGMEYFIVSRIK